MVVSSSLQHENSTKRDGSDEDFRRNRCFYELWKHSLKKKKENGVILENNIDTLVCFYWKLEILEAGLRNVTKLQGQWWKSGTSMRSGKFHRLRFSPKCPYYHWLPSYYTTLYIHSFQFAQDSRSSAVVFPPCSCHMWMVKQNNPICTSQKPPGTTESLLLCVRTGYQHSVTTSSHTLHWPSWQVY